MESEEAVRTQIEKVLAAGGSAGRVDNALFGPGGLFSRLANAEEEWSQRLRSELFRRTRERVLGLHLTELGAVRSPVEVEDASPQFPHDLVGVGAKVEPVVIRMHMVQKPSRAAAAPESGNRKTLTLESRGNAPYRLEITSTASDVLYLRFVDGPVPPGEIGIAVAGKRVDLLAPFVKGFGAEVSGRDLEGVIRGECELELWLTPS